MSRDHLVRYRVAPAATLLSCDLDAFTAVFNRPSGQTHLLVEPAPELLAALADTAMTLDELRGALASRYDLDGAEGLEERLEELVAVGLVSRASGPAA
jgi:PqqD family protein of HPr-rel-A system